MNKKWTELLRLCFALVLVCGVFLPAVSSAEEEQSPREKILIVRERAIREKTDALRLKVDAETQIRNARAILEKAKAGPNDPSLKGREEVLQRAPGALSYGERVLAKAEKALLEADMKVRWSDRALANLIDTPGTAKQYVAGGAFPLSLKWQGQVKVTNGKDYSVSTMDQRGILPGDIIKTGPDALVEIISFYNIDNVLTVGPDTQMDLARDSAEGTRWGLIKGKVHFAPASLDSKAPPRLTTPRGDVEASVGSEFDVEVDEEGQTKVTPYEGEVKIVPFPGDFVWPDLFDHEDKRPKTPWWEVSE